MATFLNELLADSLWYAYSIFLAVALIVNFYLLSHVQGNGLRVLALFVLISCMTGGIMLLRWRKSKRPRDPGDRPEELHFRAAAGKKSK